MFVALPIWSTSKYIKWSFHIDMCINESPYPQIDRWSISLLRQLTGIHVFGFVAPLSAPATKNLSKCKMDTKDVSYSEWKLLFSEARFVGFMFRLCRIHTWFLLATHTNGYTCHIESIMFIVLAPQPSSHNFYMYHFWGNQNSKILHNNEGLEDDVPFLGWVQVPC